MSKIIAVCGAPSSGKTTSALKIAQEIYLRGNCSILFISPDTNTPALSYLFPRRKDTDLFSLGGALDKTSIVYEDILKHKEFLTSNNILQEKRLERNKVEVRELVQKEIIKLVNKLQYSEDVNNLLLKTMTKEIDPYSVSKILLEKITNTGLLKK